MILAFSSKRRVVVGFLGCCAASSMAACGLLFPTALESDSDAGASGLDAAGCGTSCGADAGASDATASTDALPGDASPRDAVGPDAGSSPDASDAGLSCEGGASDPLNCGTCGHNCLGGTCFQGACRQVAILSGEHAPAYVAVDATHVYWTDDGPTTTGLFRALKDGSARGALVPSLGFANRVLSDGQFVYYNAEFNGTVARYDPGAGVNTAFAPASTSYSPTGLALSPDAGTLYWMGQLDEGGVSIRAQQLPSGPQTVLTLDTDGKIAQGLAADQSAVFFTSGVNSTPTDHQSVKRIDTAGCPGASSCGTIVHSAMYINALAVDSTYVYWAEQTVSGAGQIARRAKDVDAGGFAVIAPAVYNVQFMMVDGPTLYWTEYAPASSDGGPVGRVGRVPADGSGPATYPADHQAYPLGLAADATAIYWVNRGTITSVVNNQFGMMDGAILRMAK